MNISKGAKAQWHNGAKGINEIKRGRKGEEEMGENLTTVLHGVITE